MPSIKYNCKLLLEMWLSFLDLKIEQKLKKMAFREDKHELSSELTAVDTCVRSPVGPSLASPKSESLGENSSSNSTFDDLKSR